MIPKTYSFDIFDTCLVRAWARPTDLLWELGCQLQQENLIKISPNEWQKLRIVTEKLTRESVSHGEITMVEIYQQLGYLLGWSVEETHYVLQKEFSLERQSLYPVPAICKKIQELRSKGHKIFYISDMYLLEEQIHQLLIDNNIWHHQDRLYVSSHWKASKATGKLFDICLQQESIEPSQINHMGDNYGSDILMPEKLGIRSEFFNQTHLNRYERKLADTGLVTNRFRSLLAGTSRLTRLSDPDLAPDRKTIWDTSANVVGPVLFGYVHWCIREAQKSNIQRLYFVARDGQILHRIAQIICKSWGYDIDCRYLYGSRQAWHFPAILQIGETELEWIFDPTQFLSVRSVCERVNLTPDLIEATLQQFEFHESMWDENLTADKRMMLKQVFSTPQVVDLIVSTAETYRRKAIAYFLQEGMGDSIQFAMVDIGWHGRLQRSLSKLLTIGGLYPQSGLVGFYFGLSKRMQECSTDRLYAYFSDPDLPTSRDTLCKFRELLELFMTADHGGTMKFDLLNGKFSPVLRYEQNYNAIDWGLLIQQQAICEFSRQFTQQLKPKESIDADYLAVSEILLREFIYYPSFNESKVYGSFLFAEDQAENILYELAPVHQLKDCLNLIIKGEKMHQNIWFPASRNRSSSKLVRLLLNRNILTVVFLLLAIKRRLKNYSARNTK